MRWIDADALKLDILQTEATFGDTWVGKILKVINRSIVDEAPTVDAEPIRHGHWVDVGSEVARVCSYCHEDVLYAVMYNLKGEEVSLKYCPYCGAKMDEVTE